MSGDRRVVPADGARRYGQRRVSGRGEESRLRRLGGRLGRAIDTAWGRLCRDRPRYESYAEAAAAADRVHALDPSVAPYRCLGCAFRGRVGWHTTSPGADARTPQRWGPLW